MASELQASYVAGKTVYFLVRSSVGTIWNGAALEAYLTANYLTYDIAATEQGTASAYYIADFPAALTNGRYNYVAKEQVGVDPAETDITIATGEIVWAGPAVALVPLVNASGAVVSASGVFSTVPIASISGVNAVVPIASISGVNAVVPIASISGVQVGSGLWTNARLLDGVEHGGTTATMRLGASGSTPALFVTNLNGDAVRFAASGAAGTVAFGMIGQGLGMYLEGRLGAAQLYQNASGVGSPVLELLAEGGPGVNIEAGNAQGVHGIKIKGGTAGNNNYAVQLVKGVGANSYAVQISGSVVVSETFYFDSVEVDNDVDVFGLARLRSGLISNISGNLWGDVYRVVSGTNLLSGNVVSLFSGQLVNVFSGQLSGQLVTPASGAFGTASLNSGQLVGLYSGERVSIADTILDLPQSIESGIGATSGLTVRQAFRGVAAATFGESSGFLSGQVNATVRYQNAVGNNVARIIARVDGFGNRSGIAVNLV